MGIDINIKNKMEIHNYFEARLYGPDGELKQEARAENVVLNMYWETRFASHHHYYDRFTHICIGTGDAEPLPTDTDLKQRKGGLMAGNPTFQPDGNGGGVRKITATFPATSTYVGEIVEVGIGSVYGISTRALFRDGEGNTVAISKTENDVLIIDATVYIILNLEEGVYLTTRGESSWTSKGHYVDLRGLTTSPRLVTTAGPTYQTIMKLNEGSGNASTRTITYPQTRCLDSEGNHGFANAIIAPGYFYIPLPRPDLIPAYQLEPMKVANGDGVKTTFPIPVPEFVEGTDIVKIDGVEQVRGVDYELAHDGNSTAWLNPAIAKSAASSSKTARYGDSPLVGYTGSNHWTSSNEILEFVEPIKVEGMWLEGLHSLSALYSFPVIYSSDDGKEWVQRYNLGGERGPSATYDPPWHDFGELIEAKWWKVSNEGGYSFAGKYPKNSNSWLGLKPDDGIVFTTPPPNGSIITLQCTVDRPFKTSDYIFDVSMKIHY